MNADTMKWFGGLLTGVGWFVLVMWGKADPDAFIQFAQYTLVALMAHGATMASPPSLKVVTPAAQVPAPLPPQAGKVSGEFLLWLICAGIIFFLLTGCAGLNAQGVLTITYNSPNVKTDATLLPGVLSGVGP